MRDTSQFQSEHDNPSGIADSEQREEEVTDVNELIYSYGLQYGLLNDKDDKDLKKEEEVDPTKKEIIIADLEDAVRKLILLVVPDEIDAENHLNTTLEKAKKTKERAHKEL